MSTHNICFQGEIRKTSGYFYLELRCVIKILFLYVLVQMFVCVFYIL